MPFNMSPISVKNGLFVHVAYCITDHSGCCRKTLNTSIIACVHQGLQGHQPLGQILVMYRAVARTLIGGGGEVYIHIFGFGLTNFF